MFHRVWRICLSMWNGWRDHNDGMLSAAMAYYGAFSLFPLLLVLVASIGFVGQYSTFIREKQHVLMERVGQNVSPWLVGQLETILSGVERHAVLGGPLGLLFLIVAAIGVFMQLENVFGRIWGPASTPDEGWPAAIREALWDRLLAFITLLAIGLLMIVVFLTDMILSAIQAHVTNLPSGQTFWQVLQPSVAILCDAILLSIIYYVLPKVRVPIWAAIGGGIFAAVIWACGRWLLRLLVVSESYSAYGILGALMGVMFWYYFACTVVVLGAEFVRALTEEATHGKAKHVDQAKETT